MKRSPILLLTALALAGTASADFLALFVPPFSGSANARYAYWGGDPGQTFTGFTVASGGPNVPNDPASSLDATLTQLIPGAFITTTGNIYHPSAAPAFEVAATTTGAPRDVLFQFRTLGTPANIGSFMLTLTDGVSTALLAPSNTTLRYQAPGAILEEEWLIEWDARGVAFSASHLEITFAGTGSNMSFDDARLDVRLDTNLGIQFCAANPNSTGIPAAAGVFGSDVLSENGTELRAWNLPANQFGFFLAGRQQNFVPMPGGSQGVLCLGGAIGRYNDVITSSGPQGTLQRAVDLFAMPTPTGPIAATVGETWLFQAWYRDLNPSATSNFSTGTSVVLR